MESQPAAVPLPPADSVDLTIVDALERLGEAIRVLLWRQASQHKLSPIQLQFLQYTAHSPGSQTSVTDLARRFNLTKPTVSEAVKVLTDKHLLAREAHTTDKRAHYLRLTLEGEAVVGQIGGLSLPLIQAVDRLGAQREPLAAMLLDLVAHLQANSVITVPRMCATCRFYRQSGETGHFCQFLNAPLPAHQRRLNCHDHQPLAA